MLQSSGHWVSVLGKYYDDIIHPRWAGVHLHTTDRETTTHPLHRFLEIQYCQIINVFIIITAT